MMNKLLNLIHYEYGKEFTKTYTEASILSNKYNAEKNRRIQLEDFILGLDPTEEDFPLIVDMQIEITSEREAKSNADFKKSLPFKEGNNVR